MIARQSFHPHHTGQPSFEVQSRQAASTQHRPLPAPSGFSQEGPEFSSALCRKKAKARQLEGRSREKAALCSSSAPSEDSSPGAGRFREPDPQPGGAGKEAPHRAVPGAGGGFALGLRRGRQGGVAPEGESRSGRGEERLDWSPSCVQLLVIPSPIRASVPPFSHPDRRQDGRIKLRFAGREQVHIHPRYGARRPFARRALPGRIQLPMSPEKELCRAVGKGASAIEGRLFWPARGVGRESVVKLSLRVWEAGLVPLGADIGRLQTSEPLSVPHSEKNACFLEEPRWSP